MSGLDYVPIYLHDVEIRSHSLEEHIQKIISVVRIITFYGVKLRISKFYSVQP